MKTAEPLLQKNRRPISDPPPRPKRLPAYLTEGEAPAARRTDKSRATPVAVTFDGGTMSFTTPTASYTVDVRSGSRTAKGACCLDRGREGYRVWVKADCDCGSKLTVILSSWRNGGSKTCAKCSRSAAAKEHAVAMAPRPREAWPGWNP